LGSLLGKAAFSPTEMGYDGFELVKLDKIKEFATEHAGT